MFSKTKYAAAVFAAFAFSGVAASASTVGFDGLGGSDKNNVALGFGLVGNGLRIVNGNCPPGRAPCLAINKNERPKITEENSGVFSLTSFWYQLLGDKAALTVTTDKGSLSFAAASNGNNDGGHTVNTSALSSFMDIKYVSFDNVSGNPGNVRVDDLGVTNPAAVPLPAAGLLLIAALGGLGAMRRRKS